MEYFADVDIEVRLVNHRRSKSGDFKPSGKGRHARITVNQSLNQYAFLITLIHEMAHYFVYRQYISPKPHGIRWKSCFRELMEPLLQHHVFPDDILIPLRRYMTNPSATTTSDKNLTKALHSYNAIQTGIPLDQVPFNAAFSIETGRVFMKKELQRTRYRCLCMKTGKTYLVHASAQVTLLPK